MSLIAKIALVVIGFFLVRRMFLRSIVAVESEEEQELAAIELPQASAEERRKQEIASEVDRISTEQPDTVAALLRSWLAEGEE